MEKIMFLDYYKINNSTVLEEVAIFWTRQMYLKEANPDQSLEQFLG